MALVNAATRGLACQNCRSWVLRSFITSMGGASKPTPQRRTFTRPARNLNEAREKFQLREEHSLNSINDHVEATRDAFEAAAIEEQETSPKQDELATEETLPLESQDPATESHVPWYLQSQQEEQVVESPMAHRQKLPDLPDYAPELLQPLLQHVSVELGMDDLTLLDLRQLDPPPALGSNLLMIIGTARSEKHLHVSADRLCRWLRTEYKMKPYADGLLGRNELKLKIRRKVKRARLMSAVGSSATGRGDLDDGIRTGWVCVNVGRVEGGELPESQSKLQRAEGMVGFGAHTTGSNIVVQMLTEEKRAEVDLEKLWSGIVNRAQKAKDKELEDARIAASPEESALRDAAPKVITYRP
jgi:ribosomal silencing factor RsfS